MAKKVVKEFKEIENNDYDVNVTRVGVLSIEIYDENAKKVRTFDKNDSNSNEGFIIKAKKFARGGRLRIKYNYKEII
ncbi:MAG: hypothetical protein GX625_16380 [Clostridiaceae bacterium]|jgi:hypothetical protein|nr:hypothetical protein [Clostridiaceae bacterium]